jgi:hypothetical protein
MKRHVFGAIVAVAGIIAAVTPSAVAQYEPINAYGAACFVYQGYTYVPLRSAADFLGVSLTWHEARAQVSVYYRGNDLLLVIGSTQAYFMDRPVRLPVPPVSISDTVMVPVIIFDEYLDVSLRWAADENRVYLLGPPGWGYYDVLSYTPDYALRAIEGYGPVYAPAPFFYQDICYVPLLDWCDYLGFPIFFEPDYDDFVCNFHGTEVVLFIGRPTCFFGPRSITLRAAPCIVRNTVFVPLDFFSDPLRVPVQRQGGILRLRGENGVRQIRVAARPPAPISVSLPRQPQTLGIPVRPATLPGIVTRAPRPHVAKGAPPSFLGPTTKFAPAPGKPAPPPTAKTRPAPKFEQPRAPAHGRREEPAPRFEQPSRSFMGPKQQRGPQPGGPQTGQEQTPSHTFHEPIAPPAEKPGPPQGGHVAPFQPSPPPAAPRSPIVRGSPGPPPLFGGGARGGGFSPGRSGGGRHGFRDPVKGKSADKAQVTNSKTAPAGAKRHRTHGTHHKARAHHKTKTHHKTSRRRSTVTRQP